MEPLQNNGTDCGAGDAISAYHVAMRNFSQRRINAALVFGCLLFLAQASIADDHLADMSVPGGQPPSEDDSQHWAFRVLTQPSVPRGRDHRQIRNPIDAFIVHRLEQKGLALSDEADRPTLIRRLSFDLIGLPPLPEEVAAFLDDRSPLAFERLVDRLLASPHFGERWGRHWLDNAGYVDVEGLDNDAAIVKPMENRWLYRDYVVDAFNRDKPFDQFLTEQIAGDELVGWRKAERFTSEIREMLIATGFLRNAADDTGSNELNRRDVQQGVLERTQEVLVNNLLALTIQCAKCHDHKYEPLLQTDYYRFQALLQPAFNPDRWLQPAGRQIPAMSAVEKRQVDSHNQQLDVQIGGFRDRLATLHQTYRQQLFEQKLAQLPEPLRDDARRAIATPAEQRDEIQKYLAAKLGDFLSAKPDEIAAALSEADKVQAGELERQIAELLGLKKSIQHWQAVYDVGPPTATKLLERGDYQTPSDEVSPGMFDVLSVDAAGDVITPRFESSGRRTALAQWLTDIRSPAGSLAIRVRVNRIWQHLFGRGIVEPSDNFGLSGGAPTHPELLEWLSLAFVTDGQRLKPFLKRIVCSSTYRQTSIRHDAEAERLDPGNQLLWKQRLKRLESEAVRDAVLAASGQLNGTLGGTPVPVEPRPDGSFVIKTTALARPSDQFRRTLYLLARRNYHPTILSAFDQPNMTTNCTRRDSTAVVQQSLTMLNDPFVWEQSRALADRVVAAAKSQQEWIPLSFQIALGRGPSEQEDRWCQEAMRSEAEFHCQADPGCDRVQADRRAFERICHTLFNTSEFLLVP